jgi:hypothetical protein
LTDFANDDVIWSTNTLSTSVIYSTATAYTGLSVPPQAGNTRNVWFKFDMPLTTSATYQQNISVTIGAQQ